MVIRLSAAYITIFEKLNIATYIFLLYLQYCGKIFKVAKDLQAHLATHVGGKRFQCIHCDKELTSYRNLRNHIASIHENYRPFICQVCKKTYSKACSLQVRIRFYCQQYIIIDSKYFLLEFTADSSTTGKSQDNYGAQFIK